MDVYIPPRRDKYGRRFGFVKFIEVQNPYVMEKKLVVILIGGQRLRVNLPRFGRNNIRTYPKETKPGLVSGGGYNNLREGVSYLRAVTDGGISNNRQNHLLGRRQNGRRADKQSGNDWNGHVFNVSEE